MKIFQGMLAAGLLASTLYPCQTQAQVPAAPSRLAATSVSSSRLDLHWIDTASNESSFQLQFAKNAFFSKAQPINIGAPNVISFVHAGLGPITTYWYRIKAINVSGGSDWSNTAFATTAPGGVVARPLPRTIVAGGTVLRPSSAIDVDWTPTTNTNISGYTVRYSTDAGDGACKDRAVAGRGSSTYFATGLVPSKRYKVSVRADGGDYSSAFSAPAYATTSADGLSGIRISPLFFGQNAWLPAKIGAESKGGDLEKLLCGASYVHPGDQCVHSEVFESGVKLMRYGGRSVDRYYDAGESRAQYLTMVDNMRANGIEPLLQVPYWDGDHSAEDAAALVRYINITHDRCVRYWTIANEPNHPVDVDDGSPDKYGLDAAAIAEYFKDYVTAMRNVDPTILIVGPDLSEYDNDIMTDLLTGTGATAGSNICGRYAGADGNTHYYLDVVDFHTYPFGGAQMRQEVIDQPSNGFQDNLDALKTLVELCNGDRPAASALKMAVTEMNVEHENPADLSLSGVSAQSFLAGQYWADVMNVGMQNGLEFMAFWSVKEGDPELGYITGNDNTKLPTYYHYQMLAQNFRGVYKPATLNGSTTNVKAFGAKDLDQIVVMLLNQNEATDLTYTVQLNNGGLIFNSALAVRIGADVGVQYTSPADEPLKAQSTVMLVFDEDGVLLRRHVYALLSDGTAPPPTVTIGGTSSRVAPPKRGRPPKRKNRRQ